MSEINESSKWIEEAISKRHIKYYEYKHLKNIEEIGIGGSGKVYRAKWKNSQQYLALKSFININKGTIKELVREIELQREVVFHDNIISFYGVTILDQENQSVNNNYSLVMEYADSGSLKNYLKENFKELTWDDKFKFAHQLASAVLCLHDEDILHRDLSSNNVLINKNTIKLADFGLSKRIKELSNGTNNLFGVLPYIDPKKFINMSYSLNKKSDIYSMGVLLWEISSGQQPFYSEEYDCCLAIQIMQGLRELTVPDTPIEYVKLYTECWDNDPDNRPFIQEVVERLNVISNQKENITVHKVEELSYEELYQTRIIRRRRRHRSYRRLGQESSYEGLYKTRVIRRRRGYRNLRLLRERININALSLYGQFASHNDPLVNQFFNGIIFS